MRLSIFRHSETVSNVARVMAGQSETELTAKGLSDAALLCARLKDEWLDFAFSSDLRRAVHLGQAIVLPRGIPLLLDPRLREQSYGVLEGRSWEECRQSLRESGLRFHEYRPPEGESLVDVQARCVSFMEELRRLPDSAHVAISGHRTINKCLLLALQGLDWSAWDSFEQYNACLNVLDYTPGTAARPVVINSTSHLIPCPNHHPPACGGIG